MQQNLLTKQSALSLVTACHVDVGALIIQPRYTDIIIMKRRRTISSGSGGSSNAALVTFAINLLNVDTSVLATTSSSTFSLSSISNSGKGGYRGGISTSNTAAFSRRRGCTAFVNQDMIGNSLHKSSGRSRSNSQYIATPSSSSRTQQCTTTSPHIWKQRNVSAHLTKNRIDEVTPRYYISGPTPSHSSEEEDVVVYTSFDKEFSLLRPHLEFNELDLQELFNKEIVPSQLYEEFEEVEIGHFQSSSLIEDKKVEKTGHEKSNEKIEGPFFFASESPQNTPAPPTSSQSATTTSVDLDIDIKLPPWLSLNQARFAPRKLRRLQRDLSSHLSQKEIDQVITAIKLSSGGDEKKIAGASDFCSILVNSLEMLDVPALCAAAYHYSSLVSVRERELNINTEEECSLEERECLETAGNDAKYLCALAGSGIEQFGTHAVKIALDAARLKSMETLATTVVCKNGKVGQLRADDARNLRSLLLTVNEDGDWRALAVRAAACLYRLEGLEAYRTLLSKDTTEGSRTKTRSATPEESRTSQEALHIYAPLAARLGMFRLKTELEDAAFRTLYPRSHAKVSSLCGGENTNSVGEGMKSILSDISNQMKRLVQEDTMFMDNIESVSVTARVKEPYSVWRKMLKISKMGDGVNARDLSILDIPDAVATRVVFSARKLSPDEPDVTTQRREKELCYYLYELCTRNWHPSSDSRFKDYVKNPKDNGYQSLHYSSRKRWRGTSWPFEVQIRSEDMHRVAEYGVAAHWQYKVGEENETHRLDRTSEAYLKSVEKWRKQSNPSWASTELEEPSVYLEEEIRRQRKRERDETLAPYLEALSGDQTDMGRENVFVFVSVQPPKEEEGADSSSSSPSSEGTVLSLPRGSRVLDAIRIAEKWSSSLESGGQLYDGRNNFVALCNGLRTSSLGTELLNSGDVLNIIPSSELIPTFDDSTSSSKSKNGDMSGGPIFQ